MRHGEEEPVGAIAALPKLHRLIESGHGGLIIPGAVAGDADGLPTRGKLRRQLAGPIRQYNGPAWVSKRGVGTIGEHYGQGGQVAGHLGKVGYELLLDVQGSAKSGLRFLELVRMPQQP